jgi:hypothetical protein
MKKELALLAVSLLCFSCSDDGNSESSDVVSCEYISVQPNLHLKAELLGTRLCFELSPSGVEKEYSSIDDFKAKCENSEGKFSNGCPNKYILKCSEPDSKMYLYDNKFKGMSCNEL